MGENARSNFNSIFSLLFLSSALQFCLYQSFLPRNFREISLSPLSSELLKHLGAQGAKPSYHNNLYLSLIVVPSFTSNKTNNFIILIQKLTEV